MRNEDDDIYEFMADDTLKRAEEMCASFGSSLGLERRGQNTFYRGALADMSQGQDRFIKVTVADSGSHAEQVTIISNRPLPASNNALLVYRAGPGEDLKYMGKHGESHPGQRQDDKENDRHITTFTILRDVRKR